MGTMRRLILRDYAGALELYHKARTLAPGDATLIRGIGAAEQGLGHFDRAMEMFRQAASLDPRGSGNLNGLGTVLLRMRRPAEAREAFDRALAVAPSSLNVIEGRAMTYLEEGDLAGARESMKASAAHVDTTDLLAYFANYLDLGWVLDEPQRDVLLRLTPAAFDDDRGAWGISLAQIDALRKDSANMRRHAGEAAKAFTSAWAEDGDVRFGIINFANADMVGHTGVIPAAVTAIETVDACLAEVVAAVQATGGALLITADHGNADEMLEDDGSPDTAHSLNPVPVIVTVEGLTLRSGGALADVAPTLLELLGAEQPAAMTGRSLIER